MKRRTKNIIMQISYEEVDKIKAQLAESKKREKNNKKLFRAFLAEIDEESAERLKRVSKIIFEYTTRLGANGGWVFTSREVTNYLSRYMEPGYLTYRLVADEQGYHPQPDPPEELRGNAKVKTGRHAERRLIQEHKTELSLIHQAYLVRNDIIYNRRYQIKDPNRLPIIEEIRELLGFNNPAYSLVPNEPKTSLTIKL